MAKVKDSTYSNINWERINRNSDAQFKRKLGRTVYDSSNETWEGRGERKPFSYRPDRETVRAAKRMMLKEHKHIKEEDI